MKNAVLVLLLASLLLTGCQAPTEEAPSEPSANDTTQSTDATLSETETTPLRVITEMEATDFGGRDVHMLVRQQFLYEFSAEETGDIVSDAVYNRNLEIEDRLNQMPYVGESLIVMQGHKLNALIHPNWEEVDKANMPHSDMEKIMQANIDQLNKEIPGHCRISALKIYQEEFEKTPKRSIKRYLYQQAEEG